MKYLIAAIFMIGTAEASNIMIDGWDQIKLGHLLAKLPDAAVKRSEEPLDGGKRILTTFPKEAAAFSFACINVYFEDSPIPSNSECAITLDINSPEIEKNYDEIRTPGSFAAAELFEAFPYGKDSRSFRSGKFDEGIDFSGRKTNIFHYMITCSMKECLYRFSEKVLK
jgi:hypothetical protein